MNSTAPKLEGAATAHPCRPATAQILAKNTLWLVAGQLLGMPLGVLMNAVLARRLGAEDFGLLFLISTMSGFAATFSEFGQGGASQRALARERLRAGEIVSSALLLRTASFVAAYLALAGAVLLLGYGRPIIWGLAILGVHTFFAQFGGTAALAARAHERSDLVARNVLLLQATTAAVVFPVLLLGGDLLDVLLGQMVAGMIGAWLDWRLLARLGVRLQRFRRETVRVLAKEGVSFLVLGAVMIVQWNINVLMLSQWASPAEMGWYAASQRLVGFLIFPCTAVIGSLYPTLCRLLSEAPEEALETARSALGIVSWIALPVAVGCAVFPDVGVRIFSRESFAPAEDNLRLSALVVFGLYFSMVLATYLNALGRQHAWATLQLASVAVSTVLNAALIPVFQHSHGNGGLGVVAATVCSEAFLVAGGLWLAPRGFLRSRFARTFGWACAAALCMAIAGVFLRSLLSPWLAAPGALLVYFVGLRRTGVLNASALTLLRSMLRRRQPPAASVAAAKATL